MQVLASKDFTAAKRVASSGVQAMSLDEESSAYRFDAMTRWEDKNDRHNKDTTKINESLKPVQRMRLS